DRGGRLNPYWLARSVRILGRARIRYGGWVSTVRSAYERRPLPLAGAPRDPRGMGQPPPATRHRVPGGGEPCPQGADERPPPPADRRPRPTPGGEGGPGRG